MRSPFTEEDVRFNLIAIRKLQEQGPAALHELAGYLADPSPVTGNAAAAAIHSLSPLAALPLRWAGDPAPHSGPADIPQWLRRLCDGPASEAGLTGIFANRARALPPARLDQFFDRIALFQGLQRTFPAALKSLGMPAAARTFTRKVIALRRVQFPLQVSLSATMACQLRCDFCIAEDSRGTAAQTMQQKDARALAAWLSLHGISRLSLTGGEPTLYPGFSSLLQELRERSIELNVATNGQFSDAVLQEIIRFRPLCVSLHLAPEIRGSRMDVFQRNARAFRESGIYTIIRCNLPTPDTDHRRFIDTALETGIREIRTAIPMPNAYRVNRYTAPAEFVGFRELLGTFVSDARREGIETRLAKPYPLCLLNEITARTFLGNGSYTTNCPVHQTGFTNNLVIYPDLSFSPCLGLNVRVKKPIVTFPGLRVAALEYRSPVADLMRMTLFEHCGSCQLSQGGRCLGACLSYRSGSSALLALQEGPRSSARVIPLAGDRPPE